MQINLKVGGLTSIFQVCIVHFLVFWWPGKFWLKKGTGGDTPPPQGAVVARCMPKLDRLLLVNDPKQNPFEIFEY